MNFFFQQSNLQPSRYFCPAAWTLFAVMLFSSCSTHAVKAPSSNPQVALTQREPLRIGGKIMESKLIHKVNPVYPEQAQKIRLSGNVMLEVTVNEDGFVSDVRVISGHPLLREAAIEAVKQWQYRPTLLNGKAVPIIATITVVFKYSATMQKL